MIHVLPSGRFSFHEDDFSSAEFHEEIVSSKRADTGEVLFSTADMSRAVEEGVTLIPNVVLVAVFYFRSGMTGKREETRLVGEDAEALRELLRSRKSTRAP